MILSKVINKYRQKSKSREGPELYHQAACRGRYRKTYISVITSLSSVFLSLCLIYTEMFRVLYKYRSTTI